MARELKVWSVNLDGKHTGVVAATSRAAAARALGTTDANMRDYGSVTSNKLHVERAMREPGVAWRTRGWMEESGWPWERRVGDLWVKDDPLIAPWLCHAGRVIRQGALLRHPGGAEFVAVRLPGEHEPGDAWRAVYADATVSRLVLQIGDKGMAEVIV